MENNEVQEVQEEVSPVELSKFNLQSNDVLVVKVNSEGLTDVELLDTLKTLREDPILKALESEGNKVFFTYTGIDLSIVRMEPEDKLMVYIDTSIFENQEEKDDYVKIVKDKLQSQITNDVVTISLDAAAIKMGISKTGEV